MMTPDAPPPSFDGLTQAAYRQLEHAASLKGLLQPFKGKGELQALARVAQTLEVQVSGLMVALVRQTERLSGGRLSIRLVCQRSAAGSVYLRWRSLDYARMGVAVWDRQMADPALPEALRQALLRLELDRIGLNLQMSVLQSLYRQTANGALKMEHAQRQQPPTRHQETQP